MKKLMITTAIAVMVGVANAGPWGAAMKAFTRSGGRNVSKEVVETTEKGVAKSGGKVVARSVGVAERIVRRPSIEKSWKIGAKKSVPIAVGTVGTVAVCKESKAAEQIAKVATPGRIVAAGVGTAAVVGVHEVSDGVQSACVSVGKTVESHPESLRDLVEPLIDAARQLSLTGLALVAVILVFIFYPVLKLARHSVELWAVRREKRVLNDIAKVKGGMECGPDGVSSDVEEKSNSTSGKMLGLLTLVGTLTMGHCCEAGESYDEDIAAALERYDVKVQVAASNAFGAVREQIPMMVSKYGYVRHLCGLLVKVLVMDSVKGEKRTEDLIRQDLNIQFSQALYDSKATVDSCADELIAELEKIRVRHGREFFAEMEVADDSEAVYFKRIEGTVNANEVLAEHFREAQKDADITLIWETIFIRETIDQLAIYLGKIVMRETATAAGAAGAAACDGPLPVLDVLGGIFFVGMTGWSVYDIYNASIVLPAKMEFALTDQVDGCCCDAIKLASDNGRKILGVYRRAK